MEEKIEAKYDTTYCINKECKKRCSRHESHYKFKKGKSYCFQNYCLEYLERKCKEG